MKRNTTLLAALLLGASAVCARNVSIDAHNRDAQSVFAELMRQTGKNFIYSSDILKGVRISVKASNEPLDDVLRRMFDGTGITFTVNGNNVMLRKAKQQLAVKTPRRTAVSGYVREKGSSEPLVGALVAIDGTSNEVFTNQAGFYTIHLPEGETRLRISYPGFLPAVRTLRVPSQKSLNVSLSLDSVSGVNLKEVVVTADINNNIAMNSADIGRMNLNVTDVRNTPAILGESDVIKTLQLQPGVSMGTEGLAGMYVHGGSADENLFLLDGVPLYQVNHFGGLFSAFNTEAIKNVDFYKSSFPAIYGGRLSSVLDVHTKDGSADGHHGSLKVGLTSGAFDINGPIGSRTTYSFTIRRSWYEVLTVPGLAIYNHFRDDNTSKTIARYNFSDINAKVTHRLRDNSRLHAMFYYGEDFLKGGEETNDKGPDGTGSETRDVARLYWGNIVGSLGYDRAFSSSLFGTFTLSASHYFSKLHREALSIVSPGDGEMEQESERKQTTKNDITDLSASANFTWTPSSSHRLGFGATYTHHFFRPQENATSLYNDGEIKGNYELKQRLDADGGALYISDDWDISGPVRLSLGLRGGFYTIDKAKHLTLDPRAGVRWAVNDSWSVKASYACMTQYVHQLSESFLSLPTDQWVPISGDLHPQRSHNLSVGAYYTFGDGYTVQAEAYMRWLRNVIEYPDFYYLAPDNIPWDQLLTSGEGRAKGIDLSISKSFGKVSGHVAYSLMWADRRFDKKNHGEWYPDRYDNRHKINILINWKINDRWDVNASWSGMSGNRYTLSTQNYELLFDRDRPFIDGEFNGMIDMNEEINSRRLPFYHRLDLSANLHTHHGMWTFSLYNAYCNINTIAVRKRFWSNTMPVFQKIRLLPVIPGVSYTWYF